MNKHFSYLLDDQSANYFQKFACEMAEEHGGVSAATPAPPAMEKKASPQTGFEKIAARLDRDLGILKTAGPCGFNAGMIKRADAYIDVLLAQADLSPVEFCEVFDKVAATAIQEDLDACYREACSELDESEHWIVEKTLVKIGHDVTKLAMLEKEAFMRGLGSLLGKALTRGGGKELAMGAAGAKGALGGLARGTGKAIAKPVVGAGRAIAKPVVGAYRGAAKGIAEGVGGFRAAKRQKILSSPGQISANIGKARRAIEAGGGLKGPAGAEALKKGIAEHAKAQEKLVGQLRADKASGVALTKQQEKMLQKAQGRSAMKQQELQAAMKPTSAPKGETPLDVKTRTENTRQRLRQQKAQSEAAQAAKTPEPAGGAGKMEFGPAGGGPKPPAVDRYRWRRFGPMPEAVKEAPGLKASWTKMVQGKPLTQAERGALIDAGVKAAVGYRLVTGKGAITGGEGLI